MNLDKVVTVGRPAWRPSDAATDLDVWHADDAPIIGTFELEGVRLLFTCVGDVDRPATIWAYAPLSDTEAIQFADIQFDTLMEMYDCVSGVFDGREAVYAYARDFELIRWCPLRTTAGLYPTAHKFLDDMAQALESEYDPDARRRAEYDSGARRREARSLDEHTRQVRGLVAAGH